MCISQSDGSGRGFSAHPYPKATKDGKYELVEVGAGKFITRLRNPKKGETACVRIVGNNVRILRDGQEY